MLLILTIFEECQKVNSHELNLKLIRNRVLNFSLYQKEKKHFYNFPHFSGISEKLRKIDRTNSQFNFHNFSSSFQIIDSSFDYFNCSTFKHSKLNL